MLLYIAMGVLLSQALSAKASTSLTGELQLGIKLKLAFTGGTITILRVCRYISR